MRRLMLLIQNWTGRITYLPPMQGEVRLARNVTMAVAGVALAWAALVPSQIAGGFLIALAAMALGPLLYAGSWPIWELLVWDSKQPWATPRSQQDANYDAATEAFGAVARRRPAEVRAALANVVNPDPWRETVDLYYLALADLMERRTPDLARLADQVNKLDAGPRQDSTRVMVALVAAGSAYLSADDWRAPLLACRQELKVPRSLRGALWPMHYAYKIVGLLMLIAAVAAIAR
jgi:hypothetical protein